METVEKFIEALVKIDYMDDQESYGHYPFSLYAETSDGKHEINALALGGDILGCYQRVCHYVNENAKYVYMSVDFPANAHIEHDFVAVFSVENGESKVIAIPYDETTGEQFDIIDNSPILEIILTQFNAICLK